MDDVPFAEPRVEHVPEIASTMDAARARAVAGEPEGLVLWADRQTGGRGRDGRAWASPDGGLWASVLLRPRCDPAHWGLLPLVGGVAVADALRRFDVDAGVKWPNDVLVDARKIGGVLCESRVPPDGFVVMGFGVNVNVDEAALPEAVRGHATSVTREAGPVAVARVLDALLAALASRYALLELGARSVLLDEYRAASVTLGRPVARPDGVEGTAVDVLEDGALVVEQSDGHRVTVRNPI